MADKQKTVLYLDDETDLLLLVCDLLRAEGYRVMSAEKAEDALELLEKNLPDIILADVKLPGIDGFEFYRRVRMIENLKTTPFVFVTAFNDLAAIESARLLGASEYVTKPFDFEHLVATVQTLLTA